MIGRKWSAVGAALAGLGVIFGAFGAHALRDKIGAERLGIFHTGVEYQMYHALALILLGLLASKTRPLSDVGWLFTAGILIFGGSLYALAITDIRVLGAITPLGGLCFIAGWALLVYRLMERVESPESPPSESPDGIAP